MTYVSKKVLKKIFFLFLVLFLISCTGEDCIEADDFGEYDLDTISALSKTGICEWTRSSSSGTIGFGDETIFACLTQDVDPITYEDRDSNVSVGNCTVTNNNTEEANQGCVVFKRCSKEIGDIDNTPDDDTAEEANIRTKCETNITIDCGGDDLDKGAVLQSAYETCLGSCVDRCYELASTGGQDSYEPSWRNSHHPEQTNGVFGIELHPERTVKVKVKGRIMLSDPTSVKFNNTDNASDYRLQDTGIDVMEGESLIFNLGGGWCNCNGNDCSMSSNANDCTEKFGDFFYDPRNPNSTYYDSSLDYPDLPNALSNRINFFRRGLIYLKAHPAGYKVSSQGVEYGVPLDPKPDAWTCNYVPATAEENSLYTVNCSTNYAGTDYFENISNPDEDDINIANRIYAIEGESVEGSKGSIDRSIGGYVIPPDEWEEMVNPFEGVVCQTVGNPSVRECMKGSDEFANSDWGFIVDRRFNGDDTGVNSDKEGSVTIGGSVKSFKLAFKILGDTLNSPVTTLSGQEAGTAGTGTCTLEVRFDDVAVGNVEVDAAGDWVFLKDTQNNEVLLNEYYRLEESPSSKDLTVKVIAVDDGTGNVVDSWTDSSGQSVSCGQGLAVKIVELKELVVKKSGFVSFKIVSQDDDFVSGNNGTCDVDFDIINSKAGLEADYYESSKTVAVDSRNASWQPSGQIFVRKGQVLRFDDKNWESPDGSVMRPNTWFAGAYERQCGVGMMMSIEERPAIVCISGSNIADEYIQNPSCSNVECSGDEYDDSCLCKPEPLNVCVTQANVCPFGCLKISEENYFPDGCELSGLAHELNEQYPCSTNQECSPSDIICHTADGSPCFSGSGCISDISNDACLESDIKCRKRNGDACISGSDCFVFNLGEQCSITQSTCEQCISDLETFSNDVPGVVLADLTQCYSVENYTGIMSDLFAGGDLEQAITTAREKGLRKLSESFDSSRMILLDEFGLSPAFKLTDSTNQFLGGRYYYNNLSPRLSPADVRVYFLVLDGQNFDFSNNYNNNVGQYLLEAFPSKNAFRDGKQLAVAFAHKDWVPEVDGVDQMSMDSKFKGWVVKYNDDNELADDTPYMFNNEGELIRNDEKGVKFFEPGLSMYQVYEDEIKDMRLFFKIIDNEETDSRCTANNGIWLDVEGECRSKYFNNSGLYKISMRSEKRAGNLRDIFDMLGSVGGGIEKDFGITSRSIVGSVMRPIMETLDGKVAFVSKTKDCDLSHYNPGGLKCYESGGGSLNECTGGQFCYRECVEVKSCSYVGSEVVDDLNKDIAAYLPRLCQPEDIICHTSTGGECYEGADCLNDNSNIECTADRATCRDLSGNACVTGAGCYAVGSGRFCEEEDEENDKRCFDSSGVACNFDSTGCFKECLVPDNCNYESGEFVSNDLCTKDLLCYTPLAKTCNYDRGAGSNEDEMCYLSCAYSSDTEKRDSDQCYYQNDGSGVLKKFYTTIVSSGTYQTLFRVALIMMITFYGFGYLMGLTEFTQTQLISRLLKISFIYMLVGENGWTFYNNYVVAFFKNGIDYLVFAIAGAFDETKTIDNLFNEYNFYDKSVLFAGIDRNLSLMFSHQVQAKIWGLLFVSFFGFFYTFLMFSSILMYIFAVANAVLLYITAQVFISILLALGPIFFIFFLFEKTKGMLDKWLNNLISFSLQQIFLLTVFSFFNILIYDIIKFVLSYPVCWMPALVLRLPIIGSLELLHFWKVSGSYAGVDPQSAASNFPGLFHVLIIYLIAKIMKEFIMVMTQLASSLGGGVAVTGLVGGVHKWAAKGRALAKKPISWGTGKVTAKVKRDVFGVKSAAEIKQEKAERKKKRKDVKEGSDKSHQEWKKHRDMNLVKKGYTKSQMKKEEKKFKEDYMKKYLDKKGYDSDTIDDMMKGKGMREAASLGEFIGDRIASGWDKGARKVAQLEIRRPSREKFDAMLKEANSDQLETMKTNITDGKLRPKGGTFTMDRYNRKIRKEAFGAVGYLGGLGTRLSKFVPGHKGRLEKYRQLRALYKVYRAEGNDRTESNRKAIEYYKRAEERRNAAPAQRQNVPPAGDLRVDADVFQRENQPAGGGNNPPPDGGNNPPPDGGNNPPAGGGNNG